MYLRNLPYLTLAIAILTIALPQTAQAACTTPAGDEGDLRYSSADKEMYFCDGTSWKGTDSSAGGGAPSGYQIVSASGTFASASEGTVNVTCPGSKIIMSGGCNGGARFSLENNYPVNNKTWRCTGENPCCNARTLTALAICIDP